jgi:hypothetical protein
VTLSSAASIWGTLKYTARPCRLGRRHVGECRAQEHRSGSANRDLRPGCARRARCRVGLTRTTAHGRDHQPGTR